MEKLGLALVVVVIFYLMAAHVGLIDSGAMQAIDGILEFLKHFLTGS